MIDDFSYKKEDIRPLGTIIYPIKLDEICQVGLEVWLDKSIGIDEFLRSCIANY